MNGVIKYLVGPGVLIGGGAASPWEWKIALLLIGWILVGGSHWASDRALGREDAIRVIGMLLERTVTDFQAARPLPADMSLRANVMLIDPSANALRIAYSTPGYQAEERDLQWQRGQGCAGRAWESEETRVAPEDLPLPVAVEDADRSSRPYNMTSQQVRTTAGKTASVISSPIFVKERLVGVLNLDDTKPPAESLLGDPDIRRAVEDLTEHLSTLLEKAGAENSG
jgi:hypothetical protein